MEEVMSFEERLKRLEDRLDLEELIARYFFAVDGQDYDALAATFSEDCQFESITGRDAVMEYQRAGRSAMGPTIHTPHSALFEFDDTDHASGVVGAHCELARGDVVVIAAMQYHDRYVRTNNVGWQFSKRKVEYYYVCPWDEISNSLTATLRKRWPGQEPTSATLPRYLE
jgi:SnoaL-like protein